MADCRLKSSQSEISRFELFGHYWLRYQSTVGRYLGFVILNLEFETRSIRFMN